MRFEASEIYHVYNRGNDRQRVFYSDADYLLFVRKMRGCLYPCCDILTWCLMPNHFHLMVHANAASVVERPSFGGAKPMQELPYRIGVMLSSFSRQVNRQRGATGSLFQQKTKSVSMSEEMQRRSFPGCRGEYIINQMHCHHQNPSRSRLVSKMEDWRFSSFKDLAGLRNGTLCNKALLTDLTGYSLSTFYEDSYAVLK